MTAILEQRRSEAAVINPLVEAFEQGLGRGRTRKILAGVIKQLAVQSGREFAREVDEAFVEGFSPELELHRTQTIMEGAALCDFRYRRRE